jgi:hypothetical protein
MNRAGIVSSYGTAASKQWFSSNSFRFQVSGFIGSKLRPVAPNPET